MVHIDMQIALCLDIEINEGMSGEELEHVIEKPYPSCDLTPSGAIEIEVDGNFGFSGFSGHSGLPHVEFP
jgi:hypothetical protein